MLLLGRRCWAAPKVSKNVVATVTTKGRLVQRGDRIRIRSGESGGCGSQLGPATPNELRIAHEIHWKSLDCNLLLRSLRCTSKMVHASKWCFFTLQNAQPLRCSGYLECIETKISQQRQRSQLQEKYGRIDDIICRMFQLSSTFYTLKVWRRHAPNIKETHTQPLASRDGAGTLWNLSGEGVADPLSKCAKVRKKRGCPPKKFIKYCTGENDCSLLTKRTLGKTCWNETKKCKMFRHQKWVVVVQRSAKSLKVSRGHDSISDRMNNATSYENHVPWGKLIIYSMRNMAYQNCYFTDLC